MGVASGEGKATNMKKRGVVFERKVSDLIGHRFGKLTVISQVENKNGNSQWLCKCDCGVDARVVPELKDGTQSCGCLIGKLTI